MDFLNVEREKECQICLRRDPEGGCRDGEAAVTCFVPQGRERKEGDGGEGQ